MKNRTIKRWMAALLAASLSVSLPAVNVLAEDGEGIEQIQETNEAVEEEADVISDSTATEEIPETEADDDEAMTGGLPEVQSEADAAAEAGVTIRPEGSIDGSYIATEMDEYAPSVLEEFDMSDESLAGAGQADLIETGGERHGVVIVGWDDNYPASNFDPASGVTNDGAWLVRSSWGPERTGLDGYFWLSFDEVSVSDTAYAIDLTDPSEFDNNYQYDGSYSQNNVGFSKKTVGANLFTAGSGVETEYLRAVSVGFGNPNTNYTVDIYIDASRNEKGILQGTKVEGASVSGTAIYSGIQTIALPQTVALSQGQTFAVVVTVTRSEQPRLIMEKTSSGALNSVMAVEPGQSFIGSSLSSLKDVTAWSSSYGNLRIRAFTSDTIAEPFTQEEDTIQTEVPASFKTDPAQLGYPEVRNQGAFSTCWAFAAAGMGEIWKTVKEGDNSQDYSELALAYSTYANLPDPLGNVKDTNTIANANYSFLTLGGNYWWTFLTLSSWWGYIGEYEALYDDARTVLTDGIDAETARHDQALVTSIRRMNYYNDTALIKQNVMEQGGVGILYYHNNLGFESERTSYRYCNMNYAVIKGVVDQLYTGSKITMSNIEISIGDEVLTEGVNYTVSYEENRNPGTATVVFTGTGDRAIGTVKRTFEIEATPLYNWVSQLYSNFLSRGSDSNGIANWVSWLEDGTLTGADAVDGFVYSKEFQSKPLDNTAYVTAMYRTIFEREPDKSGLKTWVTALDNGCTRKYVLQGFLNSDEMARLSSRLGIEQGTYVSNDICDQHPQVAAFVARLYRKCLGREFERTGLTNWVTYLVNGTVTGRQAARGFTDSKELKAQNLSNMDFVTMAYNTLMDREPDASGFKTWTRMLANGGDRNTVIEGFLNSREFKEICANYGIKY